MNHFFVLYLSQVPSHLEEEISALAFEYQALGVSEKLPFSQPEGEEVVFTETPEKRSLEIFFAEPPSDLFRQKLEELCPTCKIQISEEQNRDWLAEWKKSFQPFPLVNGHWIVPSWCEAPREAKHKILIDPGMAFGTGTHETTQLVSEAMQDLLQKQSVHSCLDVGTGTGVLAILAKQLGIEKVSATELEPEARRVARENFALNKVQVFLPEVQVEEISESFDLVVANIIDGILVRIQEPLRACVNTGGTLLLSGIITEREQDFLQNFKLPKGAQWGRRRQKGDWLCYEVRL